MPTQLALYPPARGGGDSTAPIDVPVPRHHSRKVSSDSAASIENGQFGSWQMMEMSLNDKTSPINIGSFHDPTVLVVSPANKRMLNVFLLVLTNYRYEYNGYKHSF